MHGTNQQAQALIVIEGRATYERILATLTDVEHEEAIRQIQNFLKVYPEFAQAHNDLAVIFYRAGNQLLALAHHEKAHKLEPLNLTFRKNLADFYAVELDWTDEAIHIYLDILKDNPFDVETLTALGTINERAGRREQARQFFTRAHQLDPLSTSARNALHLIGGTMTPVQQVESQLLVPEAPVETIRQVIPPVSPENLHRQAMEAVAAGRGEEAIRLLEKLLSDYPSHAVAHNDLGVLYQQSGDAERARKHHEQAALLKPEDATFQKNLAELLTVCFGDHEGALKIYVNVLSSAPRDVEVLKGLAFVCIETGKPDDARVFLERILAIEPWNSDARETIRGMEEARQKAASPVRSAEDLHAEAVRLMNEGKVSEARAALEQLVSTGDTHAIVHNDLGVARYNEGDIEGARAAYERAVKLEPTNVLFRRNLADLYFSALGMLDEAIRMYLELHREQPRDTETLVSIGHICAAVGRPEEAKTFYRKVLEIEPWNSEARQALKQLNE